MRATELTHSQVRSALAVLRDVTAKKGWLLGQSPYRDHRDLRRGIPASRWSSHLRMAWFVSSGFSCWIQ